MKSIRRIDTSLCFQVESLLFATLRRRLGAVARAEMQAAFVSAANGIFVTTGHANDKAPNVLPSFHCLG